jgi:C1A family cysteine protease
MGKFSFSFVLLAVLCSLYYLQFNQTSTPTIQAEFQAFKKFYQKKYPNQKEELRRYKIFEDNYLYAQQSNGKYSGQKDGLLLGINQFSDLTIKEFRDTYLTPQVHTHTNNIKRNIEYAFYQDGHALPDSFDWRLHGAVSPVKNQGQCGSCWAFSSAGGLEGAYAAKYGKMYDLSPQHLVDCEPKSHGCNGGLMNYAFEYWINHGTILEQDYPYKGVDQDCQESKKTISETKMHSYAFVPESRPNLLKKAVHQRPVTAAIAVDGRDFMLYKSGIFKGACAEMLNHAILIVGYGTDPEPYWIIKNSWDVTWGNKGYMKMYRTELEISEEVCGLAVFPVYAKV